MGAWGPVGEGENEGAVAASSLASPQWKGGGVSAWKMAMVGMIVPIMIVPIMIMPFMIMMALLGIIIIVQKRAC